MEKCASYMIKFLISSSLFTNFLGFYLSQENRVISFYVQYPSVPSIFYYVYTCGCVCDVLVWVTGGAKVMMSSGRSPT
jgi:hypothetical protein